MYYEEEDIHIADIKELSSSEKCALQTSDKVGCQLLKEYITDEFDELEETHYTYVVAVGHNTQAEFTSEDRFIGYLKGLAATLAVLALWKDVFIIPPEGLNIMQEQGLADSLQKLNIPVRHTTATESLVSFVVDQL